MSDPETPTGPSSELAEEDLETMAGGSGVDYEPTPSPIQTYE